MIGSKKMRGADTGMAGEDIDSIGIVRLPDAAENQEGGERRKQAIPNP